MFYSLDIKKNPKTKLGSPLVTNPARANFTQIQNTPNSF